MPKVAKAKKLAKPKKASKITKSDKKKKAKSITKKKKGEKKKADKKVKKKRSIAVKKKSTTNKKNVKPKRKAKVEKKKVITKKKKRSPKASSQKNKNTVATEPSAGALALDAIENSSLSFIEKAKAIESNPAALAEAVRRLRADFPDHPVHAVIPPSFPDGGYVEENYGTNLNYSNAGWQTWPRKKRGACDWGLCYVAEGRYAGQFGYHDDDEEDAVVYFGQPLLGPCAEIPHKKLRKPPFEGEMIAM